MSFLRVLWVFCIILASNRAMAGEAFSEQAWQKIRPIYKDILDHPFNQELQQGTLAKVRFDFYSNQDQLYLKTFARSLIMLAAKLDDEQDRELVRKFAEDCLHESQSTPTSNTRAMSPANILYTDFLLKTATYKSREELAAALLPCFWIYQRLAKDLKTHEQLPNPYDDWIRFYSGVEYGKSVQLMIALVDKIANDATPRQRARMLDAFVTASKMEWYFWDCAYKMEVQLPYKTQFLPQIDDRLETYEPNSVIAFTLET